MATRRDFLQQGLGVVGAGLCTVPLIGCAARSVAPHSTVSVSKPASHAAAPATASKPMARASEQSAPSGTELAPPPDIFDAQALDLEFWLRPVLSKWCVRPAGNGPSCCTGVMAS
ncbi:hypothetical protein ACFQT4_15600 [Pseudoduganella danionis]|uniref:hypothetical protein n=1 Tax=Pseudoduganella danionis TaxID=1890295 RepID=UPI00361F1C13